MKGTRPHSAEEGQQWKESDVANTLTAYDIGEQRCNELAVKVFGICSKDSNAMKSDNPHSGFYEAETTRTLDANGGNPTCNQGGMAVVAIEGNGSRPSHQGRGYSEEDVSFTLNATEQHGVAQPVYCTSKASFHLEAEEGLVNTLVATDYKDPPIVSEGPSAGSRRPNAPACRDFPTGGVPISAPKSQRKRILLSGGTCSKPIVESRARARRRTTLKS